VPHGRRVKSALLRLRHNFGLTNIEVTGLFATASQARSDSRNLARQGAFAVAAFAAKGEYSPQLFPRPRREDHDVVTAEWSEVP
jgi:hypothetical protein